MMGLLHKISISRGNVGFLEKIFDFATWISDTISSRPAKPLPIFRHAQMWRVFLFGGETK